MLLQNNNEHFPVKFKNKIRNKTELSGFGQFDSNKH